MTESKTNALGIDAYTKDKCKLINRLAALKTTTSVEMGGEYHNDRSLCQIHITTSWTEKELEDWLYKTKGIDYLGVFTRENVNEQD